MISLAMKHLKLITAHKFYVMKYCWKAGLYWRGITHDLSKYTHKEFFESIKYYTGTDSPIVMCKKINGYSIAWQNHKGHNNHHYEYWTDQYDKGTVAIQMPFACALEMVCDYLGAAKAYMKKDFTYEAEYEWVLNKFSQPCKIHSHTKTFVQFILYELSIGKTNCLKKRNAKQIYKALENENFRKRMEKKLNGNQEQPGIV